jgi:hypothetical protein
VKNHHDRSSRHKGKYSSKRVDQRRKSLVGLDTKTVKGSSLSLERVDDVESGDGLSLGVLSVGDRISNDVCNTNKKQT